MNTTSNRLATRRGVLRTALGVTGAAVSAAGATRRPLEPLSPGIKITLQLPTTFTDDDLKFARQIGVGYVTVGTTGGTYEMFADFKRRIEAAGLKVTNIGNIQRPQHAGGHPEPSRPRPEDRRVQAVSPQPRQGRHLLHHLRPHGKRHLEFARPKPPAAALRPAPSIRRTPRATGAVKVFEPPLTHGRSFTKEEIWENYTYFIKQVVPVAEEQGVRIGIHPDDPPVPELGGVPRCIFGNFDGYVRALEIANSPNVGVCLCCGTWMEGGKYMGKDVFEAARAFAKMGKLWKIHFRNVSAPIPNFVEAFVDDGYTDMKKLMRTLVDVDFRGILIADHVPGMVGGRNRLGLQHRLHPGAPRHGT